MQLEIKKYVLQLKHTFTISRESHDTQDTLIVCLTRDGHTGYGESTSNPYYRITLESMQKEIEAIRPEIEKFPFDKPEEFHQFLLKKGLSSFAVCALDLAAHDLYGKLKGEPLYKIWGTSIENYPITNFTIGLDKIEVMLAKMKEKPWPIYKIKLGTKNDLDLVSELRKHTSSVFRVDANCAWEVDQTIAYSEKLKELGVEFIEQPLVANDRRGLKKVMENSALPIIADESCIVEEDVEKCAGIVDGINIKLTKCGGLTPALRMIRKARNYDLKVMVGCMTESSVGISAIAQLLPQLDYVDMDGAMLLKEDIAHGVVIKDDAKVIFPKLNGSGITLLHE
ncbi:dipeptide epimerase [Gramella sp. AN32]|uniref:Dipeptide epimerase n=1 Tax=Christiangramia antarctica TaxID=2058158 RepID=A0ABW5X8N3_9FLAO|nr:dipeptide epimerase [Gramella sp. AN32]MCM4154637.1 dipeptide epimerase [Gramella sp. AN32]